MENVNEVVKTETEEFQAEEVVETETEVQEEVTEEVVETEDTKETVEEVTEESVEETTEEVTEEPSIDYALEYSNLKEQFEVLMAEVEELRAYKANIEAEKRASMETEVFSKFESKLGDFDEYTSLKESASEFSIEELEDKCFAIAGRHGVNLFEAVEEVDESVNTKFSFVPETKKPSKYGNVFELYSNN